MGLGKVLLIGGAGAYLTYLIMRPDPSDDTPAPSTPTPGLTYVTGRPAPLIPGTTYYGRAQIGWPTSMLVTSSAVQSKLASEGFTDITVWTSASDLPSTWPAGETTGNLFVQATYPATATATTMAVPSQVIDIWTD